MSSTHRRYRNKERESYETFEKGKKEFEKKRTKDRDKVRKEA